VLGTPDAGFSHDETEKPMSIKTTNAENGIDAEPEITGPHMEPPELSNATTYWRCEGCGYESIREKDLHRPTFHANGCANAGGVCGNGRS
jgi:hypothetical protein